MRGIWWGTVWSLREWLDSGRRGAMFWVTLVCLFLASFAVPIFFAARVSRTTVVVSSSRSDSLFPQATVIGRGAGVLRIRDAKDLQPQAGEDFVISIWVNPKRPPRDGGRTEILAKYSIKGPGYGFALASDGVAIRPEVRWVGSNGKGKWYTFGEIPLVLERWHLFVITFVQGRYLGLHGAVRIAAGKPDVVLLGGYDLKEEQLPISDAPFEVGAIAGGGFRGMIGPFAVFSAQGLGEHSKTLAKKLAREPVEIPSEVLGRGVRLWSLDGVADQSPFAHDIRANAGILRSRGGRDAGESAERPAEGAGEE